MADSSMPELLTQQEAVKALRLDDMDIKNPKESLRYLRRTGQLTYFKVAGKIVIPRKAIKDYLDDHRTDAREN